MPSPGVDSDRALEYDVRISHAETEMREIVSFIERFLVEKHGLRIFVDFKSFGFGDQAPTGLEEAA